MRQGAFNELAVDNFIAERTRRACSAISGVTAPLLAL